MSDQVQCPNPNCGGYRVSTQEKSVFVANDTGQVRNKPAWALTLSVSIVLCLILAAIGGVAVGIISLLALVVLCLIFKAQHEPIFGWQRLGTTQRTRWHHSCDLCGYKWERGETDPQPPVNVNVRSDLIQKGAQLNEQIAQQQAAAAAYLQQQQERQRRQGK